MKSRNYISFSIYGDIEKYLSILTYNIEFIQKYNFEIVLYCEEKNIAYLKTIFKDIFIINGFINGIENKMLWRLNPMFSNFSDCFFARDADSKITEREVNLMNIFIDSNYNFHIIRDHELHYMPIMGGLFGIKKDIYNILTSNSLLNRIKKVKNKYNYDQLYLSDYIYPIVISYTLIHTSSYYYKNENYFEIDKALTYCGMYDNLTLAKFDKEKDHINIINRPPIYYIVGKIFRYKWFLYIKKNNAK
jgi:hypothetical protein